MPSSPEFGGTAIFILDRLGVIMERGLRAPTGGEELTGSRTLTASAGAASDSP